VTLDATLQITTNTEPPVSLSIRYL